MKFTTRDAKIFFIGAIIAFAISSVYLFFNKTNGKLDNIDNGGKANKVYYDKSIKDLKKENKALYDSVSKYKNVESALLIKYRYKYSTDTVYTSSPISSEPIKVYNYKKDNDTISYDLAIGSSQEPKWYKLIFSLKDNITVINKKDGDINQTIVSPSTNADITITPFHTKEKNKFWKRFVIGPQIGVYYGTLNKKPDIGFGFGLSFNINQK